MIYPIQIKNPNTIRITSLLFFGAFCGKSSNVTLLFIVVGYKKSLLTSSLFCEFLFYKSFYTLGVSVDVFKLSKNKDSNAGYN